MKVRFDTISLSSSGSGSITIPLKCWRVTMVLQPSIGVIYNGQNWGGDLSGAVGTEIGGTLVIGGVLVDGKPVNIDQELKLFVPTVARGIILLEYLEP